MKIVTWNVNGIRSCLKKGMIDSLLEIDADIICLQEVRAKPEQIKLELPGYDIYWNPAEKAGYSGTALITRRHPLRVWHESPDTSLNGEGRLITAEFENFFLVNCYSPTSGADFSRLSFRMQWDKSFLQSIYGIADEAMPDEKGGPRVKGYLLAALARSHKGTYNEFCETTAEYIKDFNMHGMTPSMVAFELLERGVLSCIPAMLLKLVDERYGDLSFTAQTKALSDFNLTPLEAEATTAIIAKSRHNAALVVKEVAASGKDILSVLHSIGCGDAYAKEPECLCLCTAINKVCPYPERSLCVGCKYEISTKSTLLLMLSEYSRMAYLHKREDCTANERLKNRKIVEEFIIPKITELLSAIRDIYGDDAYKDYSGLVRRFL